MKQPSGFVDPARSNHVCRLTKSLYGLKQASQAWYNRFSTFLLSMGFKHSLSDASLFIYQQGEHLAYLLLYVDGIVFTASNQHLLGVIIAQLSAEFAMSDLGPLYHFLGINVTRDNRDLFLSQSQYARDILHRANSTACKPCNTAGQHQLQVECH